MWILWKGRPSIGQCKVQFPSNLFECQNRYHFFLSLDSITTSIFCFFAIFLFFEIIRIVVASYLNLISYFFSTTVNDAAPNVPLRFSPSYRSKINLIPQFRLLVHARCVNATTMLVEMYILFETRDPPLYCCYLSMWTMVPRHKSLVPKLRSPFFLLFSFPSFPYEPHLLLNIEFYLFERDSDIG